MGMAASQARLLSITTRMSDNELRSQLINNSKMRLATESSQVSENYINALNEAQYMFTNYDADNKASYQQLTFNALTAYNEYNNQYGVSNSAGQILVSERDAKRFEQADGSLETFLGSYGLEYKTSYWEELENQFGTDKIILDTIKNIDGTTTTNYSKYNASELQEIYEGTEGNPKTHYGYENGLMSKEFNEYTKLEKEYSTAKENYYAIIEKAMGNYAEGVVGNGMSFKDLKKNVQDRTGDPVQLLDNFEKIIDQMQTEGKFSNAANYEFEGGNYNFHDYMIKLIDDCKYSGTNHDTKVEQTTGEYSTDGGNSVFEFELDGDYTVKLTKDAAGSYTAKLFDSDGEVPATDAEGTPIYDSITYDSTTGKFRIGFYNNDGNAVEDIFTATIPSWTGTPSGDKDVQITEKISGQTKNDIYFDNLDSLIGYFNDAMINAFDASKFNDPAIMGSYTDQYNAYANAAQKLSNFIFGKDVGFSEYGNLGDYKWCTDKGGTTKAYTPVSDVLAIEELFAVYGEPKYSYIKEGDPDANGDAEAEWYTNLFNRMSEGYKVLENGLASSAEWMRYALESGLIKMEQVDKNQKWNSITFTSCSDITEQTNDKAVTIAEAEYQKAMNKIENKDKIYDMELKNIDTEHTALQTEYDSIKSALDKNVERNFKLYS